MELLILRLKFNLKDTLKKCLIHFFRREPLNEITPTAVFHIIFVFRGENFSRLEKNQ